MAALEILTLLAPPTLGALGWLLGYHLLGDAAPALGQEGR